MLSTFYSSHCSVEIMGKCSVERLCTLLHTDYESGNYDGKGEKEKINLQWSLAESVCFSTRNI